MDDLASTRHQVVVTVSGIQLHHAGQDPNRGLPAYKVMYPMGDPALVAHDPIFVSKHHRYLAADHGWVTGDQTEPPTRTLAVAGADRVDAGAFRALGANSGLLRPLVTRDFQVWWLPGRQARDGKKCHEWRLGVRLGPNTPRELPRRIYELAATPPGIRKTGFRKVMEALRRKGQVGYPPSVATDAQLEFSSMAYQSAGLPLGRCDGGGHILVR